jgi:hypothetical protein
VSARQAVEPERAPQRFLGLPCPRAGEVRLGSRARDGRPWSAGCSRGRPVQVLLDSNSGPRAAVDSILDLRPQILCGGRIEYEQGVTGLKLEHLDTDSVRLAQIGVDDDSHPGGSNATRNDSARRIVF